jgi:predicted nucleotidyltransferase
MREGFSRFLLESGIYLEYIAVQSTMQNDILQTLQNNKPLLTEKYGLTKIGVFGSFARGEATEDSDVDICIETDRTDPFLIVHLKEDLEQLFHRRVDVVEKHKYMRPLFRKRLEQETIYV